MLTKYVFLVFCFQMSVLGELEVSCVLLLSGFTNLLFNAVLSLLCIAGIRHPSKSLFPPDTSDLSGQMVSSPAETTAASGEVVINTPSIQIIIFIPIIHKCDQIIICSAEVLLRPVFLS